MPTDPAAGMTPRILLVDDERQIFAAVRLRLGRDYELCHRTDAASALACIRTDRFDLCFVDIHMPGKDGLTFIAEAQEVDPHLGFVVISAFDTAENLRRAIPLQVYAFIGKPLPDKAGFEGKVPEWIERTRRCRHDQGLARRADAIATDLASARRLRGQIGFYRSLRRLLRAWRVFHVVLAIFLVVAIAVHVGVTVYLGYGWGWSKDT